MDESKKNIFQSLQLSQNATSFISRIKKKFPTPTPLTNLMSEYKSINPYSYDLSNKINWDAFSTFILKHYNQTSSNISRDKQKQLLSSIKVQNPFNMNRIILKHEKPKSLWEGFRYQEKLSSCSSIDHDSNPFDLRRNSSLFSKGQKNQRMMDVNGQLILKNRRKSCEGDIYGRKSRKVEKLDLLSGKTFIQQKLIQKQKQIEEHPGFYSRLPFKIIIKTKKLTKRFMKYRQPVEKKNKIMIKKSKSVIPPLCTINQSVKGSLSFDDKQMFNDIPQLSYLSEEILEKIQWIIKNKIKKQFRYGKNSKDHSFMRYKYFRNGRWNFKFNMKEDPSQYYIFSKEFLQDNHLRNKNNFTLLRKYLPKQGPISKIIKNYQSQQDPKSLKVPPKVTLHQTTRMKTVESDTDYIRKSQCQKVIQLCPIERKITDAYALIYSQRFSNSVTNNQKQIARQNSSPYYENFKKIKAKLKQK